MKFENNKEVIELKNGNVMLIGGRPGTGKTQMALDIISNVAINENKTVLLFNLELSKENCIERIMKKYDGLNQKHLSNIIIDDTPAISIDMILEKSKNLKLEKDIALVAIDYLQLLKDYCNCKHEILKLFKKLAIEINIPIIICSQLSRNTDVKKLIVSNLNDNNFDNVNLILD